METTNLEIIDRLLSWANPLSHLPIRTLARFGRVFQMRPVRAALRNMVIKKYGETA